MTNKESTVDHSSSRADAVKDIGKAALALVAIGASGCTCTHEEVYGAFELLAVFVAFIALAIHALIEAARRMVAGRPRRLFVLALVAFALPAHAQTRGINGALTPDPPAATIAPAPPASEGSVPPMLRASEAVVPATVPPGAANLTVPVVPLDCARCAQQVAGVVAPAKPWPVWATVLIVVASAGLATVEQLHSFGALK